MASYVEAWFTKEMFYMCLMKQALQAVSYKIGEQLFCDLRLLELMMAYAGKGNEGFPNLQFKRIITCMHKWKQF